MCVHALGNVIKLAAETQTSKHNKIYCNMNETFVTKSAAEWKDREHASSVLCGSCLAISGVVASTR